METFLFRHGKSLIINVHYTDIFKEIQAGSWRFPRDFDPSTWGSKSQGSRLHPNTTSDCLAIPAYQYGRYLRGRQATLELPHSFPLPREIWTCSDEIMEFRLDASSPHFAVVSNHSTNAYLKAPMLFILLDVQTLSLHPGQDSQVDQRLGSLH